MGTIEISNLLSYTVPLLVMYNAWLHQKVIKMQIDIAVNTSKDEEIIKNFEEHKNDMKAFLSKLQATLDNLSLEVHQTKGAVENMRANGNV